MKMKPVLFSTPMVQAILEDRKTKTRRVIKPQPFARHLSYMRIEERGVVKALQNGPDYPDGPEDEVTAPYQPGDILWGRETWRQYRKAVGQGEGFHVKWFYAYKADKDNPAVRKSSEWYDNIKPLWGGLIHEYKKGSWRPSIFMPREAARIFLRVTDVQVERVQDITPQDAKAEGVTIENYIARGGYAGDDSPHYHETFAELWDSLNAKRGFGWAENPWVWVYTFERCEKPVDE